MPDRWEPSDRIVSSCRIPDWSKRIPALDGLRGIAILMVLMRHSIFVMKTHSRILLPILAAGKLTWSGVDLFFVLSGFLIGGILLDAKHSPRYFKTFYLRRVFRIFPLYYLVVGLFLFSRLPFRILPGTIGEHVPVSIPWIAYLTLTQNFWIAGLPGAMEATWSLCIEEQFYLVIPLVIRNLTRRQLVATLVAVVASVPALRVLMHYYYPHGDYFCYVLTPCRADVLCLGVLAAVLVRTPAGWRLLLSRRMWLRGGLLLLFAGVVYMTWAGYGAFRPPMTTFGLSCIAFFYTLVLLAVVSTNRETVRDVLCNRWLTKLGTLAYCLYLVHVPLIHAGRWAFATALRKSDNAAWFLGGMLGIAASLIVASFSWTYFEKPLLKIGHKYQY
jgi:peptidoglycan/LPS O-acetylase OafA/YrhL